MYFQDLKWWKKPRWSQSETPGPKLWKAAYQLPEGLDDAWALPILIAKENREIYKAGDKVQGPWQR